MNAPHSHPRGLRETQEWLSRCILDEARLTAAAADAVLTSPPSGDLAARLHAYADGYPARIHEALGETFPAVLHLIGHQAAMEMTRRYLAACPPRTFNLNHAGDALVAFLRADVLTSRFPFLPDLALFELQMIRAFHAEQMPVLDPATLAGLDQEAWAAAILRFQPAVAVISSPWPVRDLHAARETPLDEIDIDLRDRPDHVLIRREGLAVHCDGLDVAEAQALAALVRGESLAAVLEQLADSAHDSSAISTWFARWMQLGLIIAVER